MARHILHPHAQCRAINCCIDSSIYLGRRRLLFLDSRCLLILYADRFFIVMLLMLVFLDLATIGGEGRERSG